MGEQDQAEQVGEQQGDAGAGRKRDRTLIEFPYSDMGRAHELTKALGESGGKVWIEQTQLAVALDMAASGGTFRGRLSAAKMFGFIETEGGKVRISDLGLHLLNESTERGAKVEAFLRIPLYKAMYDSYNGFALPPAAAIERQMHTMGVPPKQTERARQAFAASAQTAGYIASNGRFSKPTTTPVPARDEGGESERGNGGGGYTPPPPPPLPPQITDTALEYKLVDLMREDGIESDERDAIWTLLQYLTAKAKKAAPDKKTAVDPLS